MQVQPYLCFEGRAREAIDFYQRALGAELQSKLTFAEIPEPSGEGGCMAPEHPPIPPDNICHASLKIGQTEVMITDGMGQGPGEFKGISLALTLESDAEVQERFEALASDGQVLQPLSPTFFASSFGMVADRFGVVWMLVTASESPSEGCVQTPEAARAH